MDDLPDLSAFAVKKPKIDGDPSVARVVDDELSKLGWSDNARLSMLGDVGRENSWNRNTIFKGHTDPENKEYNRGIISWQKDRVKKLDNYLKQNKLYGLNNDDEIRGMVRFLDDEMASSAEWKDIHKKMRDPNISTYDASENLRKYIKYVPGGKYNTYDPEFRVQNNARWAKQARTLGLGQLPDLSQFNGAQDLPDLTEFSQLPDLTEFATETRVQPTKELDATIQGQIQSANDPNVKTRFGVLATEPEQATLFANQPNFKPFEMEGIGTLWLNTAKIYKDKKLKLKNEKDLQQYLKNPKALTTLIGVAEDVGNETRGTAVRAKDPKTGVELATGVVTNPVSAVEQAQNYKDQFPNAEIEVTDTDVVTDERKQGEEIDRLAPTSLTGEADDVAPVYPTQQTTQPVIASKGQPKAVPPIKPTPVSGKPSETPVLMEQDYQDYFKAYPDIIDTPANRIAAAELHRIGKWNTEAQRKRLGESDEPVILDEPEVQRVSAKDADNAIADTFDVNGLSIEDATKKVRSQLSAKYDKDFSKLVLTDTQGNPLTDSAQLKKPIALTYGKLKTYGVDTEPLVTQRVAETRIEDPEPNLDVKSDFSAEDAESLNNTFGTTVGSAIASTLNAGGNTANALAGLLKVIQDLNPAKLDSMAEASKLKPYRAGEDVVKYLQGVGASTGALTAKTGDKYYEPATADDKGYLEGRPVEKETWATTGGKAVGALADMPRIALMPGGLAAPMLSFATDAMLQAASQGEEVDWSKVKKAGTHGAVLGGIAQVAPFVGKAGNTAISTLLNKASSNVLKEGITLGTIGGGTYVASREMGASRDAAFREAVLFSAMHGFGVLKKMVGEPIRVKDTNGNEAVIKVSEDGKVETLDPKTEAKAQMVIPKEVETKIQEYLKKDAEIQAEAAKTVDAVSTENVSPKNKNIDTKQPSVDSVNISNLLERKPVDKSVEIADLKQKRDDAIADIQNKIDDLALDPKAKPEINKLKAEIVATTKEYNDQIRQANKAVVDKQIDQTVADTTLTPEKAAEDILKTYESTNTPNTNVEPTKTAEVKTDSNVRSEGKTESKIDEIRPQGTRTTDSVQPTEGTKPSKIGVSIERKAIEKGLTDTFEGTAGYEPTTVKEQAKMIADVLTNPERVQRIIEGKEAVPNGLRQSYFIKGVEDNALATGDVATLKALAKSKLTSDTSTFAQEMRMMGERSQDSVTAQVNELRRIRRTAQETKGHDVQGIEKRISDLEAKLVEREKMIAAMEIKGKVAAEEAQTRPLLDRAEKYAQRLRTDAEKSREALKKRGNVFTSGVDPIALGHLAKIGASHIADLGLNFAKFSDKMVAEFGDKIKPHLKDIYEKAQEVATRFERRALRMIETRLATQIEALERQIETKTRDVVTRQPIPLSEKGKELQAKRDALRKELDEIVPKERQSRTVEQKQQAYKKNLERQITELDKQIEAKSKPIRIKTPTTPEIDALKKKRDDLTVKRDEAIGQPPKPTPEEAKINARTKALEKQIDDLNKEIANKQRMVKAKPRKVVSDRIIELEKKRDVIKEQRDKLLPKPSKPMSVEMKQSLYVKNLQRQIDALNKQIETGMKPAKGKPLPTNPQIDALKAQREALKAKLPAVDKSISDAQYNKTRKTTLEKQIAALDAEIKSGVKQTKEKMVRKLSPEVEKLVQKRDALKTQHTEVFGKPEMSDAKRLQLWKKNADTRIAILKGEKEAPTKREPIELDAEGQKLQTQINLLKSKVDLTDAEIEKIVELTKTVADTRAQLEGHRRTPLGKATPEETAYATASVMLSNYVDNLKFKAGRTRLAEIQEADTRGKLKIFARGAMKLALEHPGFTKNILASLDASATALTGWRMGWAHPTIWAKNAAKAQADIVKTFGNQPVADALKIDIQGRPNQTNGTYKKMGLDVSAREEDFPMQNPFGRLGAVIDKIPAKKGWTPTQVGKQALKTVPNAFVASENAFVGFQHRNRADVADLLLPRFESTPRTEMDYKNLGRLINGLTGRGYLGKNVEKAATVVNLLMFAPRFLKSELDAFGHIITGGATVPEMVQAALGKKDGNAGTNFVRVEALKNLVKFVSGTATVLAMANALKPGSVDFDPRSADFGKIKIGNTRFDVSGHMGSLFTLAARIASGETKSGKTGDITKLNEKDKKGKNKWGGRTTLDIFEDYVEGKASPYGHFFLDWLKGEDFNGNPVDLKTYASWDRAITNMHTPLPVKNVEELLNDPNAAPLWAGIIADYFGVTTNTYGGSKHVQRLINEARERGDKKEVERLQPILIEEQKLEAAKDAKRQAELGTPVVQPQGMPMQKK